jgi:hypothetical protein
LLIANDIKEFMSKTNCQRKIPSEANNALLNYLGKSIVGLHTAGLQTKLAF